MESSAASNQSLQETDDYLFLDPRGSRGATGLGLSDVGGMGLGGAAGTGGSGTGRTRRMAFSEGRCLLLEVLDMSSTGTWRSGLRRLVRGLHMAEPKFLTPEGLLGS
jgi:hypothetical protein